MKDRIKELAKQVSQGLFTGERILGDAIVEEMTTLAQEVYEDAAKIAESKFCGCGERNNGPHNGGCLFMVGLALAEEIRAKANKL